MSRPRLLDLGSGAGGAAMGYHRAGFEVVGVDIVEQPHYPFEFHRADALTFRLTGFDAIHASMPCQLFIRSGMFDKSRYEDLLTPLRERLEREVDVPWVLENVPGAPMRADIVLCGSMFGLGIRRHRWFESNAPLPPWTLACDHSRPVTGVYGHPHGAQGAAPGMLPGDAATWSREMGIDWMTTAELALAIPPAFTEWIGARLLALPPVHVG